MVTDWGHPSDKGSGVKTHPSPYKHTRTDKEPQLLQAEVPPGVYVLQINHSFIPQSLVAHDVSPRLVIYAIVKQWLIPKLLHSPPLSFPSQPASRITYGAGAQKHSNTRPHNPHDNPLPDGTFCPCVSWTSGSAWRSQGSDPCLPTACSPTDTGADRCTQPACVCEGVRSVSQRAQLREISEREKERDRGGEGEKEG